MDTEPFRYPVRGDTGRYAVPVLGGVVLAIGIGIRYASVLSPSLLAVVPFGGAFCATSLCAGYLTAVLTESGASPPSPSARLARTGLTTVGLSIVVLPVPVGLLLTGLVSVSTLPPDAGTGLVVGSTLGATGALGLFLAATYVFPVVVARAVEGSVREAVTSGGIVPVVRQTGYLTWWAIGFSLIALGFGLLSVTLNSGQFGGVVAAFAAAYTLLVGARATRRGYEHAVGR